MDEMNNSMYWHDVFSFELLLSVRQNVQSWKTGIQNQKSKKMFLVRKNSIRNMVSEKIFLARKVVSMLEKIV